MPLAIKFRFILASLSLITFPAGLSLLLNHASHLIEWELAFLGNIPISIPLILDGTALIFSTTVLIISANVFFFAQGYIKAEPHMHRFIHLLSLFVASINALIFCPNLIILLLGWDGLGTVSFLLVIYYHTPSTLGGGIITALTNRLGDIALIVGIAVSIPSANWGLPFLTPSTPLVLAVLLAAITKRAQFPFSPWLPIAIAAPTPVSALVHSSTLVTAGVFLLIRLSPILHQIQWFAPTLLIISSITILTAALTALLETDIKKIVAYSTLRQLGVIIAALGLNSPYLALFHLLTHAIFKALLFICVGSYIHYHEHRQDLRTVGNLNTHIPLTQAATTISNLALIGTPFLAAFYSKDPIIELTKTSPTNFTISILFLFSTALTATYTARATYIRQLGMNIQPPLLNIHNTRIFFWAPTAVLSLAAIVWGATLNWLILPPLPIAPISPTGASAPLVALLVGLIMGLFFSKFNAHTPLPHLPHNFTTALWFLTPLSTQHIIKPPLSLGTNLLARADQGWTEIITRQGSQHLVKKSNQALQPSLTTAPTILLLIRLTLVLPLASYAL